MSDFDDNEGDNSPRRWLWLLLVVLIAGGGVAWWKLANHTTASAPRTERITMVSLPPRPTPPPVQQPPEQKVAETKPRMDDARPDTPKPEPIKPPDEPPPSMGSNIKGDGADSFGLSGSGNGGRVGFGGHGTGGGNGYSLYAGQLQARLAEALRQDARTRAAAFNLKIKVWVDDSGQITRAEPGGSGSPAQAVIGVRLAQRPPAGMPMPIALRLVARRPN